MPRHRIKRALATTPLLIALDGGAAEASEADFDVGAFDAIRFSGAATMLIRQGTEPRLHAIGSQARLERLEVGVDDGRLEIRDRGIRGRADDGRLTLEIVTPSLTSLASAGDVSVRAERLSGASLAIEARGDADYDLPEVDVESLDVKLRGDADVEVAGRAASSRLSAFGDARYDGVGLSSDTVDVDIRGDADVEVRAHSTLDVSIYGDGRIRYVGSPRVTQRVFGDGIIAPLGE